MGRNFKRTAAIFLIPLWVSSAADGYVSSRHGGKVPYKGRWVTVLKKGKLFKYKRREFSSPRIDGDRLYIGSDTGYLYAIKKKTGRKIWRFRTEGSVNSTPAVAGGRVFFGDDKGIFYGIETQMGKEIWRRDLGAEILAEPALWKERVFTTTVEGRMVALATDSGETIWDRERIPGSGMTIRGNSAPAIDEKTGRLFVGFADGTLVCLDAARGRTIWEKSFEEGEGFHDIDMKPLLTKEMLYIATFDGKLYALSKAHGTVKWSQLLGSGARILASDDRLYVSGSDGVLYALADKDGSKIWETDLKMKGTGALTAPVLYKDILAVGLSEQAMNFVEASSGRLLWRRFARKGVFSDPVIDENRIYYLSNAGRLYSLKFVR